MLGLIALVGDLSWSLVLGLPRATAEGLSLKFSGFVIPFDTDDMGDVVGELANILAGEVTAKLEAIGVGVRMSLPTVTRGGDLTLVHPGRIFAMKMRFVVPQGPLWVGLAVGQSVSTTVRPGSI